MFRCVVCPLQAPTYETVEELEIHIAADHISHIPYECERCRFSKFPTEFALISHYTTDHGLKEFYVSCLIYCTINARVSIRVNIFYLYRVQNWMKHYMFYYQANHMF